MRANLCEIIFFFSDSPRKWVLFHRIALVFCIAGIVALLLSRGHYSIDCVIAYWATTRIWWMYHTLAKSEYLKSSNNEENDLKGMWWWHIFHFFEGKKIFRENNIFFCKQTRHK